MNLINSNPFFTVLNEGFSSIFHLKIKTAGRLISYE